MPLEALPVEVIRVVLAIAVLILHVVAVAAIFIVLLLYSGVVVATLLCTDQDDTDAVSNYTIASGDTSGQFTIDAGTNDVKTTSTALDYETTKWYTLLIDVVDTLTTQKTGTATVYVTVNIRKCCILCYL